MNKLLTAILFCILLLLTFQKAFAQSTPSAQVVPNVDYALPYTGILPDNPLYFLKALRDNVIGFFITDPLEKANYDLLMADKRVGGAQALLSENNTSLSITTLSKAGNYFDQAIQRAVDAKKQGEDINDIVSKLVSASMKHQFIISQMVSVASADAKGDFISLQNRAAGFQKTAESIKP